MVRYYVVGIVSRLVRNTWRNLQWSWVLDRAEGYIPTVQRACPRADIFLVPNTTIKPGFMYEIRLSLPEELFISLRILIWSEQYKIILQL
jgi:hypothetical protein